MIKGTSREWTVEDADLQIGDAHFWNVDVEVLIEREMCHVGPAGISVSGEFSFTHPAPESLFFGDDDVPEKLDAVATAETDDETVTIEIEELLVSRADGNEAEFIAYNADMIVESKEEPTPEERAIRLLDDLACEIADGDVSVNRVEFSRDRLDPIRYMVGQSVPVMGPTTLKVVYGE